MARLLRAPPPEQPAVDPAECNHELLYGLARRGDRLEGNAWLTFSPNLPTGSMRIYLGKKRVVTVENPKWCRQCRHVINDAEPQPEPPPPKLKLKAKPNGKQQRRRKAKSK